MELIFIIIPLIAVAGICNGIMDSIKVNQLDKKSWGNKWHWTFDMSKPMPTIMESGGELFRIKQDRKPWYYFGLFKPEFVEAFPYSSTVLVFLTDKWHFMKWVMFTCYETSIMLLVWRSENMNLYFIPLGIVGLKIVRGIMFSFKYDKK